ncbi:hypothetical protein ABE61_19480 [Lysinibacillus sphaericus]|uniref:dihydrofolate reductase family protein n=1 Tax=Lysinibacillus sphaericus TaxID=1421 RepID=UPI0018CC928A|nr:dihydrofolate reductase family protein [Lysinibacillus sphaericus]MBG9456164.1 hypothetical protein [Lysinibacillus sphaericus]MBG9479160.1 hypothetical protein [Lysinibacillus sphaericus]MBG9591543.1 hypothetical protein [Lysinibacillus sphaericus]
MSREIILYIATSLDGYIAKENDDLQWLEEAEGEGDAGYSDMYQSIDTIIMGKRTYDWVVDHIEPFPYLDKKCYVFTTSLSGQNEHVEFVNEDIVAFTKKLREQEGSKIWMVGGAGILDHFIKEQLIDEIIITVTPHLLGTGIPLFKDNNPFQDLELVNTQRYGQMVQMHYKVKKKVR